MKKFLGILVLGLFLITSSWADDIRDFQIEGMSIGDSLLDYFSEEEIKNNDLKYFKKNKKFIATGFTNHPKLKTYDWLEIAHKRNDKKYIIHTLSGVLAYRNDFKGCLAKKKEITREFKVIFSTKPTINSFSHPADPSGNSITDHITFDFDSGEVADIHCSNWDENYRIKYNYKEGLTIQLLSKDVSAWMRDRDY